MALFRRKKIDPAVLPEVDQYYAAERRERTGLAWLLALVSIVLVAGVIVALFLGGRYLYNKVADAPEDEQTASNENVPSFDGDSSENSSDESSDQAENNGQPATDPEPADDEEVAVAPTPTPTPAPSTNNNSLPSTGPADTVAVFTAVSTLAAGAHYAITRRKA